MKIAVISDIHGNMEALKAVLSDIESQGAEKIYILGDLAMAGAEPVETVDFIQNLSLKKDITIIQGNTDEMVANATGEPNDPFIPPNEVMANALKYAIKIVPQDQKDFLANLPATYSEKVGELNILLVHGSPRRNNEDIMPDITQEKLEEITNGIDADIIFCGHTHMPVVHKLDNKIIVNVGSVGRPFARTTESSYYILDVSGKDFKLTHRLVSYDVEKSAKKLSELPFEGSDKLAGMLLKATSRYPQ